MVEAVRLVIWDLDETYWRGTLTEGGISLRPDCLQVVKTLAQRGIVSSICSKNNFGDVKNILVEQEAWDYFIFPSINWEPKGPRIANLIEDVQLRPSTVMFIDDNHQNLEEARHFTPDIQVESDAFVTHILQDPRFVGKEDAGHARLNQYKILEKRKDDETKSGADVTSFLRESRIKIRFEHDLNAHLGRVVELINRTNQLNFTKLRLPEAIDAAKDKITQQLKSYDVQGMLIQVKDKYGDHGFCGFYLYHSVEKRLIHFCFSCRILGMGVEQFIYKRLQKPTIDIKGEVISNLFDESKPYDWIQLDSGEADDHGAVDVIGPVTAHGQCDMGALIHYLSVNSGDTVGEYTVQRDGTNIRLDHSAFLRYAATGLPPGGLDVARRLGYYPEDFESRVFAEIPGHTVLLGFASDALHGLYRHRRTGVALPFFLPNARNDKDIREIDISSVGLGPEDGWMAEAHAFLASEFDGLDAAMLVTEENLRIIRSKISPSSKVIIIELNEVLFSDKGLPHEPLPWYARFNNLVRSVFSDCPGVRFIRPGDYITDAAQQIDGLHFERPVYFKMYKAILAEIQASKIPPVIEGQEEMALTRPHSADAAAGGESASPGP